MKHAVSMRLGGGVVGRSESKTCRPGNHGRVLCAADDQGVPVGAFLSPFLFPLVVDEGEKGGRT
jgi:hypothetical protein